MEQDKALTDLTRALGYSFDDPSLLDEALTHRSFAARNNERLEFLGDGILNFVIADELFRRYADVQEGDLSRLRASLVNKESLAVIANHLKLGDVIKLGSGELKSGGFRRPSILADAVESILGAVYLDGGFEPCRELIIRLYHDKLSSPADLQQLKDPKTRLQELLQSRRVPLPVYEVTEVRGRAHSQVFQVRCSIESLSITVEGEGRSRRKAEQVAAEKAIAEVERDFATGAGERTATN